MNDFDVNVGFWIKNVPYYFESAKTIKSSKRNYLREFNEFKDVSKCGNAMITNYFQGVKNKRAVKFMEGRHHYDNHIPKTPFNVIIPDNTPNALSLRLEPYNKEFSLFSLICSQMATGGRSDWIDILKVLKNCPLAETCNPCTDIGAKIAKSLIKIASLRIFADPEQSIMELPVNSLDAYNPENKIGKFGMGFFSIFYWLIDHPKRSLTLQSFFKDYITFSVTIRDVKGVLAFSLQTFPHSKVTRTGLSIFLDAKDDNFDLINVTNFNEQLDKLNYSNGATIHRSRTPMWWDFSDVKTKSTGKDIYCKVNQNYILVEDYASGISYETLFGSLFVPSISTKTLKMTAKISFENNSRIVETNEKSRLLFLVGGIAVISIPSKDAFGENYIIDLPVDTRLPVSRDDIILDGTTSKILGESINILFANAASSSSFYEIERNKYRYRDVSKLQNLLEKYIEFTPNTDNKKIVRNVVNNFYLKMKHVLAPTVYSLLYRNLSTNFIMSNVYDALTIEKWLDENTKPDTTIWYGTKIIYTSNSGFDTSDGGLTNYMFIDNEYKKRLGANWISSITTSYFYKKLYPVNSSYGRKEYEKYEKDTKASTIIKNKILLDYFYSVLNKIESLDDKFIIETDTVNTIATYLLAMYGHISEEDFLKIITTFLGHLSSFQGNQTYGGVKYYLKAKLVPEILDEFAAPGFDTEKFEMFAVQNIFYYIKSIREGNFTDINFVGMYSPKLLYNDIYKRNLKTRKNSLKFFKRLFEVSDNFIDFSFVWLGAGLAFMKQESPELSDAIINQIVGYYMEKHKSRKNGGAELIHLYGLYNMLPYNIATTFVVLLKDTMEAMEWIKTVADIKSIAVGTPLPSVNGPNFYLSSLIRTLFNKQLENDMKFFHNIPSERSDNKLQIIEIAINEGTVKPYIEAVMTELVQNSIDAIREFKPKVSDIAINLTKLENKLILTIKDYVGMTHNAFIYVGIPFLSTKTPSELVTGEMGSGFFNSYREADRVVVKSTKDGVTRTSIDVPIRDENKRTVDILKTINIRENSRVAKGEDGTTIEIIIPFSSDSDYANIVSRTMYTANNVLGLASHAQIYFNGKNVYIPREFLAKVGHFEIYGTDRKNMHESYLLTKGIPFSPIAVYFKDILSPAMITAISNNFIINITHGGYTPVQTRTRINMPLSVMHDFKKVAIYTAFIYSLETAAANYYSALLDHTFSSADIFQLRFNVGPNTSDTLPDNEVLLRTTDSDFLKYTSFFGQPSITRLINMCIDNLGYEALKPEVRRVYIRASYKSPNQLVNDNVYVMVDRWFSYKKVTKEKVKIVKVAEEEDIPDIPDPEITRIVECWLRAFWGIAVEQKINGFGKIPSIKAAISYKDKDKAGFYRPADNSITINCYSWTKKTRKEIIDVLDTKNTDEIETKLKKNDIWDSFFAYRFPSSVLAHELEHARRSTSHSGAGGHDSFSGSLFPGEIPMTRTFDQTANAVFQKVLANGFYFEFFKNLNRAK